MLVSLGELCKVVCIGVWCFQEWMVLFGVLECISVACEVVCGGCAGMFARKAYSSFSHSVK